MYRVNWYESSTGETEGVFFLRARLLSEAGMLAALDDALDGGFQVVAVADRGFEVQVTLRCTEESVTHYNLFTAERVS